MVTFVSEGREEKKIAAETMKLYLQKAVEEMKPLDPAWKITSVSDLSGDVP